MGPWLRSPRAGAEAEEKETRRPRRPPKDPDAPVSGTLRVFAYQDTVADDLLDPFRKQNPNLDVKTASFGSDEEAAAKLAGGFKADVVEVCLDEMQPAAQHAGCCARSILPGSPTGTSSCSATHRGCATVTTCWSCRCRPDPRA